MTSLALSQSPARNGRATALKDEPLRALFWHWGRGGAGSKYTFELVRAAATCDGVEPHVSAVENCELAQLIRSLPMATPLCEIQTFAGAKDTITGKLAALRGLAGIARIGRQFEAYVKDNQIDVVICTMLSIWDVAVLPALRRMGTPFVLVMHDATPHPGDSYPFRRLAMRHEIAAADGVVVLTDHVRRQAMQRHGIAAERLWTIPHGSFDFGAQGLRKLPRDRHPRLLFFGRILAYKGLGLLLEAYHELRRDGVKVDLDIMGSGDIAPYAPMLAGLEGVRLTNRWIDDGEIGAALADAEIMVLPYVEASQSGVAAAAAAAGMPTVATPVGGLTEQVRHEETGLVCDEVTAPSLANAIRRLIASPQLYETCSARALAHAREDLGWGTIGARMVDVARETVRRAQAERRA